MSDDWFAPKRFGYGAGLPIAWQGWALVGAHLAVIAVLAAALLPRHPGLFAALVLALTVPFMLITARHTRGGWRWRWG